MPHPLLIAAIVYLLVSLATMIVYWRDKWAAERGRTRTRERTLHMLALFGGWPGALLAQQVFKHKRAKTGFVLMTYAIAAIHFGAWGAVIYAALTN